jgi:hypothetical protein
MRIAALADAYNGGHLAPEAHALAEQVLEALEDVADSVGRPYSPTLRRSAGDLYAHALVRVCRAANGTVYEVRVALHGHEVTEYHLGGLGSGPHLLLSRHGWGVTVDQWCEALSLVPMRPMGEASDD